MAKPRTVITPEEGADLKRLYAELEAASREANAVLRSAGMSSQAFQDADKKVGIVIGQIKRILGVAGSHWMEI